MVTDPMSLLSVRLEPYYMITFRDYYGARLNSTLLEPIELFDGELRNLIGNFANLDDSNDTCPCGCKELLDNIDSNREYYKIIYNFLNGESVSIETVKYLMPYMQADRLHCPQSRSCQNSRHTQPKRSA